jgi:SAM-dependent methyltransferase
VSSPVSRFRNAPLSTRFFLAARWMLTPYRRMAAVLPDAGSMLDLGCGHGLLAFAAIDGSPRRQILGTDHDAARITLASDAARDIDNLRFEVGDLSDPPTGEYAAIALIDLMHYFERPKQEEILRTAGERLARGGTLVVRDVDPNGGFVSAVNRLWEKIAIGSGFTRTKKSGFHFRTREEWEALFRQLGFDVTSRRCSFFLFADVLFVGVKR